MEQPPTETFKYVGPKNVGFCDKCKRDIYELGTFEEERFSDKPEGREWLRNYVAEKLKASGVIPEDVFDRIVNSIVHRAFRHGGTHKRWDRYVPDGKGGMKLIKGTFGCIEHADSEMEWIVKNPPPPISRTRFSLKAFVKMDE